MTCRRIAVCLRQKQKQTVNQLIEVVQGFYQRLCGFVSVIPSRLHLLPPFFQLAPRSCYENGYGVPRGPFFSAAPTGPAVSNGMRVMST